MPSQGDAQRDRTSTSRNVDRPGVSGGQRAALRRSWCQRDRHHAGTLAASSGAAAAIGARPVEGASPADHGGRAPPCNWANHRPYRCPAMHSRGHTGRGVACGAALGMLEIGEGPPWPMSCRRSLLTSRPETALWLVLVAFQVWTAARSAADPRRACATPERLSDRSERRMHAPEGLFSRDVQQQ
jgi:hypothetical protein